MYCLQHEDFKDEEPDFRGLSKPEIWVDDSKKEESEEKAL